MPTLTFIEPSGVRHRVIGELGATVMQAAVKNAVPVIIAECGGQAACGTCHVYVEPEWFDRLPAAKEMETSLLEFGSDPQETSRLSCQIQITEALEGLIVRLPEQEP